MEQLTQDERDAVSRKRFYAIPTHLVIEAQKMAVSIDDICIEALKHRIQEKKELRAVTQFLEKQRLLTNSVTLQHTNK
jgi:hypothetical protein